MKDREEYISILEQDNAELKKQLEEYKYSHSCSFKKMQQKNKQLQQENEILKEDIKDVDIWNKFYPDFLDLYLKIKNEKERSNSKNE